MNIKLRTNDGRIVATFDLTAYTVHKRVKQGTHMLRIPPSWTYDDSIYRQVKSWVEKNRDKAKDLQFVIECSDTGRTYRISWNNFNKNAKLMKWRQNRSEKQWAVLLKHWTLDGEESEEQLKLF